MPANRAAAHRFLVLGCGSIGRRHIRNLRHLGADDVLAFDPEEGRLAAVRQEYGVQPCASLEEAYGRHPHAAVICAPTSLHLPLAREALTHGCHIFLEKPLSHTLEGVDELLAEAAQRQRVLLVGHNLRFDPLLQQLRTWLHDRRIGRVVSARLHFGSYLPWRHPDEDYRAGYGARRELGGGVVLDAIHELDSALWLFGRPQAIFCVAGKFSDLDIDVEDTAELLMRYGEGYVVSIHLDYVQRPHQRWYEVVGTRGYMRWDAVAALLRLFDGDRGEWTEISGDADTNAPYLSEMVHFLNCLNGAEVPLVSPGDAREALALAMTALRSATEPAQFAVRAAPR